jgi:hypothetical protein
VDADLGTLATALFVKSDDLLKDSPQLAPHRPEAGITPQLSDAGLVTLSVMQAVPGFTSERKWLRHARSHLRHLFPYRPGQSGYNKRLRKAADLIRNVTRLLAAGTTVRQPLAILLGLRLLFWACVCTWCAPCTACRPPSP